MTKGTVNPRALVESVTGTMVRRMALRRLGRWVGALALGAAFLFLVASLFVGWRYRARIVPASEAPSSEVALVFGAGLAPGQAPSPLLAERVDAAIALYRAGRVRRLLMSGDNSDRFHDETYAMRRYALQQGVPEADVLGDDLGLSTFDSVVRAQRVFGVERVLLVTQRFHLPRALFIANSIGLEAYGVAADEGREPVSSYGVREFLSRPLALAMVLLDPDPSPRSANGQEN